MKDIVTIASVAIGTATLTVMLLWSGSLEAGDDGPGLVTKIAQPKLVVSGIELTLATAGHRDFQAGDEPAFEVTAVNTRDVPTTVAFLLAMTETAPANRLSRVLPMPSMLWQQPQSLVLKPRETKTVVVATKTKLPANRLIAVSLQAGKSAKKAPTTPGQFLPMVALQPGSSVKKARVFPQSRIMALSFSTTPAAAQPALATAQLPTSR